MGNLINRGQPYVHSNSQNFVGVTTLARGREDSKIDKILSQLETVRDQLKNRAETFCDGPVTKKRLNEIFGGNSGEDYIKFIQIMKEVMLSSQMKQLLTKKREYDFNKLKNIVSDKVLQKLNISELGSDTLQEKEVIDAILKSIGLGKEITIDLEGQKAAMKRAFRGENKNKVEQIYTTRLYKKKGKIMKQRILEMLQGAIKEKQSNEVFLQSFEVQVRMRAQQEGIDLTSSDNKKINTLLKKVVNELRSEMKVLDSAQASGQITEQGMGIIFNQADNEISIEIIGEKSEAEVQQKLILLNKTITTTSSSTGIMKDQDKQSYSDWLITRNGITVRVQVKNYRSAIENFLQSRKSGKDASGGAYIHLFHENTQYEDFLDQLLSTSSGLSSVKKEDLDYVIANDSWFSKRVSYGHNKSLGRNYNSQKANVELFMTNAFLNYLGIVIGDGTVVNHDMSNIFYYVMGDGFIPTYVIIEQAISYFRDMKAEMTRLHLKFSSSIPSTSAKAFYEAKRAAISSNSGIRYSDSGLLEVGQKMGESILQSTIIQGLNLHIDANKLYSSSYSFM